MKCPNKKCRRVTDRQITKVDKTGRVYTGCHVCLPREFNAHVYTGRKIWTGEDAYGVERNAEMNYDFEKKAMEGAARQRRRMDLDSRLAEAGL